MITVCFMNRVSLLTKLFPADLILQKAILHVQALCEAASDSATLHYLEPQNPKQRFLLYM